MLDKLDFARLQSLSLRCSSFFMIAFASYVDSVPDFSQTFSDWLKVRRESILFVRRCLHTEICSGKDRDLEVSPFGTQSLP